MEKVKVSTAAGHGDARMLKLGNILDLSPEAATKIQRRMPKQHAVGPDETASEVWIAGGNKLAKLSSELMRRVVLNGTIPQWKVGATLQKGKVTLQIATRIADC